MNEVHKSMNETKFFSLLPTVTITNEERNKKIEEQENLVKAGKSFAERLSINRFLHKKLTDFTLEERLNLYTTLSNYDFVYTENPLSFLGFDIDSLAAILEEHCQVNGVYAFDVHYIENLLRGKDLLNISFEMDEEEWSIQEVLEQFVFQTSGMSMGDTPNLVLMLIVKKALLGSYVATKNVETLQAGQNQLYDVSVLF